jgi:signal transduction histidine kinase
MVMFIFGTVLPGSFYLRELISAFPNISFSFLAAMWLSFTKAREQPKRPFSLKPVTRACLSAFLGFAASTFHDRISAAHSLRADRDEMLQCLLQEYDQDRTNFLARAVHDFRAPLTATSGYCGLLLSEALGPLTDDQKEVLRRMQHSTKRLSRMASAMFELSVGRHIRRA